jgi:hypothetical protein
MISKTKKKPSVKGLKNELDIVFSKLVRRRGHCERCGIRDNLQCCHVMSRRHQQTRWDLDNAMCLCAGCHLWWHHNPIEAGRWYDEKYGVDSYNLIKEKSQKIAKIDYAQKLVGLTKKLCVDRPVNMC